MGWLKSLCDRRNPSRSTMSGSWGSERVAGPNTGVAPFATSNVDWWHGQSSRSIDCW